MCRKQVLRRAGWAVALCVCLPAWAGAQRAPERQTARQAAREAQRQRLDADAVGPGEVQKLFDAYTAMAAQEALSLDDEQFARFLPRLRALQDVRRRHEFARQRQTAALAGLLTGAAATDDAQVKAALAALDDVEARTWPEVRTALAALDQTLDLRRQARFRVFERQMERRKLELVLRARRADGARQPR